MGLGIGLSIVKQLVELHGGTVRAKSPGIGQGATFIVTLPLPATTQDEADARRVHPKAEPTSPSADMCDGVNLSGVRVLVCDDEADARTLISHILRTCHADVVTAASVDEAMEEIQRSAPDVLISDLGMPDKDGYDLIRAVRALPQGKGAHPGAGAVRLRALGRSPPRDDVGVSDTRGKAGRTRRAPRGRRQPRRSSRRIILAAQRSRLGSLCASRNGRPWEHASPPSAALPYG